MPYKITNQFHRPYMIKGYGWLKPGETAIVQDNPGDGTSLSVETIGTTQTKEEKTFNLPTKEEKKPNSSWSETEIKNWILNKKIPVDYDIKKQKKGDILKKLKDLGHI